MSTRAQKRAKRMRARAEQATHRGRQKQVTFADGTELTITGGPKHAPGYRKSDPPKHGDRLDARGVIDKHLAELGLTDPPAETRREFARLAKATGSPVVAKQVLESNLEQAKQRAATKLRGDAQSARQAEVHQVVVHHADHPKDEEWEEIVSAAKAKRKGPKGYTIAGKAAGFVLAQDADPKKLSSWSRGLA